MSSYDTSKNKFSKSELPQPRQNSSLRVILHYLVKLEMELEQRNKMENSFPSKCKLLVEALAYWARPYLSTLGAFLD